MFPPSKFTLQGRLPVWASCKIWTGTLLPHAAKTLASILPPLLRAIHHDHWLLILGLLDWPWHPAYTASTSPRSQAWAWEGRLT